MISKSCTHRYRGMIGIDVNFARQNAAGNEIHQVYPQSKNMVISVLPPERSVK